MKIILGTMNFGPQLDLEASRVMVNSFLESPYRELDTAYVYNDGITESIMGEILMKIEPSSYSLATKVHPRITGKLDRNAVMLQFTESLSRMNLSSVDILYFHFPDAKTPIESALEACAELYEKGKIKELGLSNFPSWLMTDIWHLCDRYGCPRPAVYQGMYNALCRNVEMELFPALRHLGMRFYAFNPLAGGLLTGKHAHFEDTPLSGRFERLKSYRDRYWKKTYFDALELIKSKCEEEGVTMAEVAYRWLVNHSCLLTEKGDGVIMGASNLLQMEQNMKNLTKGPLSNSLILALNDAWEEAKRDSPSYFNFF